MFVNRRTFISKVGCRDAAVEVCLGEIHRNNALASVQVSEFGNWETLIMDIPVESMEAHDQFWQSWGETEEAKAFFEKWFAVISPGGTNEFWQVNGAGLPQGEQTLPFIERLVVPVKPGGMDGLVEALEDGRQRFPMPFQIMTAVWGPFDRLVVDIGFSNQQQREQAWSTWVNDPAYGPFVEKWNQLTVEGTTTQLWRVLR